MGQISEAGTEGRTGGAGAKHKSEQDLLKVSTILAIDF